MAVKVCDALCGFGKTSACIKMMNEAVDRKFIFVTQFLSEVERIKKGCASRGFVSPTSDRRMGRTKLSDIHTLMQSGENIATTHSLFVSYTDETKDLIRSGEYTLVLDESVNVLCSSEMAECDLDILKRSNAVREKDGIIEWMFDDYVGAENGKFREEMMRARSNNFFRFGENYFFWSIPPELFTCFEDVYVLTYMFQAQPLKCFFDVHNIEHEYIGVRKTSDGYEYCDVGDMDRALDLRSKIHILNDKKINSIGDDRTALSVAWYRRAAQEEDLGQIERLRKNISNVFKNVFKAPSRECLWTTFKDCVPMLSGKGYQAAFIPFNMRASNDYADRRYLAYCVNNFPRPLESRYYAEHGVEWDGNMYALSTLIQWLFRSAIRKGEEVWLYIPSERMRVLLQTWLENLANGNDLLPINYKKRRKSRATGNKAGRPVLNKR